MLDKKVIATHVTNLTDARYFAARGVDYLLFDMSSISIEQIIEIKEWVEGPDILLLFTAESLSFLDEAIIRVSPAGISGVSSEIIAEMSHLDAHVDIYLWSTQQIKIHDVLFKLIGRPEDISLVHGDEGLILSGGREEITGIKSFDALDEILDSLEIN